MKNLKKFLSAFFAALMLMSICAVSVGANTAEGVLFSEDFNGANASVNLYKDVAYKGDNLGSVTIENGYAKLGAAVGGYANIYPGTAWDSAYNDGYVLLDFDLKLTATSKFTMNTYAADESTRLSKIQFVNGTINVNDAAADFGAQITSAYGYNTWYNMRILLDLAADKEYIYLNGATIAETKFYSSVTAADFSFLLMENSPNGGTATVCVDNISIKAFAAEAAATSAATAAITKKNSVLFSENYNWSNADLAAYKAVATSGDSTVSVTDGYVTVAVPTAGKAANFYSGASVPTGHNYVLLEMDMQPTDTTTIKWMAYDSDATSRAALIQQNGSKFFANGTQLGTYQTGAWHNVKALLDLTNKKQHIYVDGVQLTESGGMDFYAAADDFAYWLFEATASGGNGLTYVDNIRIQAFNSEVAATAAIKAQYIFEYVLSDELEGEATAAWGEFLPVAESLSATAAEKTAAAQQLEETATILKSRELGEDKLYITSSVYEVSGAPASDFSNGDTVTFSVDVYNTATQIKNVIAVIACYEGEKLVGIEFDTNENHMVNTGSAELRATLTVPETGNHTIKGFLWNCTNSLQPYTAALPLYMAQQQ